VEDRATGQHVALPGRDRRAGIEPPQLQASDRAESRAQLTEEGRVPRPAGQSRARTALPAGLLQREERLHLLAQTAGLGALRVVGPDRSEVALQVPALPAEALGAARGQGAGGRARVGVMHHRPVPHVVRRPVRTTTGRGACERLRHRAVQVQLVQHQPGREVREQHQSLLRRVVQVVRPDQGRADVPVGVLPGRGSGQRYPAVPLPQQRQGEHQILAALHHEQPHLAATGQVPGGREQQVRSEERVGLDRPALQLAPGGGQQPGREVG